MTPTGADHQSPGDYLAAADVEFAAGNHDAGSTLLMQSARSALAQLASDYGKPAATSAQLREFAEWLDEERDADGWHSRNLLTADTIGHPEKLRALPPDRRHYHSKSAVREFISALLAYRQRELVTPGDYLAAADREFAAGNYDQGALLLYDSAFCAFSRLAKAREMPCQTPDDLREIARWLDKRHGGDRYAQNLRAVNLLRDNANYHFMAQEDTDFIRPAARDFVKALAAYHLLMRE